ncbi:putative membrane protein [Oopsacas minuta]|uniref:Membrane protein n=1 Tax=Oopsacas minuta TaxID=111878 RepID=A0AAV7KMI8_9METZ|nr:putative membrane protein [Oopsacas minuta]
MLLEYANSDIPWLYISFSTLCWTTLYFIIYGLIHKPEHSVRIVTVCHALSSMCLCFYICVIKSPFPLFPWGVGQQNTWWHDLGMTYSLGYFLFDLTWSLYMQSEKQIMLAHHVVSIFGFFTTLRIGVSGCEILATTGGAEVSNPFLQLRWLLQHEQRLDTEFGKFVEHMFLLVWFVVRMGIGTVLYIVVVLSSQPPLIIKFGANCMFTVSCAFTYGIIQYYRKRFGNIFLLPRYFLKELPTFVRTRWKSFHFKLI